MHYIIAIWIAIFSEVIFMSASSKEFKIDEPKKAISRDDLDFLINQIAHLSTQYQAKSARRFSLGAHKDEVSTINAKAQAFLKDIDDAIMIQKAQGLSDASIKKETDTKITAVYLELTRLLQKQYDTGKDKWEESNKKIISKDMQDSTKYDMYACLLLNAEPDKHSSTRNVGLVLQNIYKKLNDEEKMRWMASLKSAEELIARKTQSPR